VRLGILDWGIGGVGFYALARARLPELPVVYWSDAGAIPYGKQAPAELAGRVVTIARWLKSEAGITHLAIACNAASSVLPRIDPSDELCGRIVRQRVAQPISARVEAGDLSSDGLHRDLDGIMAPLRGVDSLILACTHYPALLGAFAQRAPGAEIVDPAAELLAWAVDAWQLDMAVAGSEPDRVLTTGDVEATTRSALLAFGMKIDPVSVSI
jgi:glutamate racemase